MPRKTGIKVKENNPRSSGKPEAMMGKRINIRRREVGMSQAELGDKLGVSFQQVQKYEKGINRVGATRLEKIATALEAPVSFFYGEGANEKNREVDTLLSIDPNFSVRLLRAYVSVKNKSVQRQFVSLIETVAGVQE